MENRAKRVIHYPITVGFKLDWETRQELDIIALFDRKKVATWVRDTVISAVRRYQRNPQYKRFKRDLEAKLAKEDEQREL